MLVRLGPGVEFELDSPQVAADGFRAVVCGESGSGKSHAAASILGQCLEQGGQAVVFDAHGEYQHLSFLSADVHLTGYDVGGAPELGRVEEYVSLVGDGRSLFLNLLEWTDVDTEALNAFAFPFLRALLKLQRRRPQPLLLLVEETQALAPRIRYEGEAKKSRLIAGIATGGRKFGINTVYCTQKPSLIDGTVLSSCNVKVFMRISEREDWDTVRRYIPGRLGITYDETEASGMRYFEPGEAVVLSRWAADARTRLLLPPISPSIAIA